MPLLPVKLQKMRLLIKLQISHPQPMRMLTKHHSKPLQWMVTINMQLLLARLEPLRILSPLEEHQQLVHLPALLLVKVLLLLARVLVLRLLEPLGKMKWLLQVTKLPKACWHLQKVKVQGLLQDKQQPQARLPVRVAKLLLMEQPCQDQPNLELLEQLAAQMEMPTQPPALPSMQLMFQELLSEGRAREA